MNLPVFELDSVTRRFPGVTALDAVPLRLVGGEVHALVGENGAGKSTLINLFAGVLLPDAGTVRIDGQPVVMPNPVAARQRGIVTVHQEAELFGPLSIAENLALSQGLPANRWGWVRWRQVWREGREVAATLREPLDVRRPAESLRVAERHMTQVAYAVSQKARLLILDEPTSALSGAEAAWLFEQVRRLRSAGVAILYVSHRLEEVLELADRITVLRDGRWIWTKAKSEVDRESLVNAMVGRELPTRARHQPANVLGAPRLEVRDLTDSTDRFRGISLSVAAGEIVGLYGLIGAGRTEFAQALFGMTRLACGTVKLDGVAIQPETPAAARRAGIAYLPEDRLRDGLCRNLSIQTNATLSSLSRWSVGPLVSPAKETSAVRAEIERLGTRYRSLQHPVGELSGGNQQKVVFARWLLTQPKMLLLDEPTRGVDVGAKAEIFALTRQAADAGSAVLLISSDLPEVMNYADRLVVFRAGAVAGEFDPRTSSPEAIANAALPQEGSVSGTAARAAVAKRRWQIGNEVGLAVALAVLASALAVTAPSFREPQNLFGVLASAAVWTVLALAAGAVIIAGGIDISIGALAALSASVAAAAMKAVPDPTAGLVVGLTVGVVGGLINASIALVGRVHPIVVTLGMLTVYRGMLRLVFAGGQWTMLDVPESFRTLALSTVGGVSGSVWVTIVVAIACHVWLTRFVSGRHLFAWGSSPSAARFAGISRTTVWLTAFGVGGGLAALAGMMELARNGSMQATLGLNWELRAITAAVVGGVAVAGGRGSVLGIVLGALLLTLIQNAVTLWRTNIPTTAFDLVVGGLLVFAVVLDTLLRRRREANQ